MASFAAFGSISALLFVEFGGPLRDRLLAQVTLILTQLLLITIGTVAGQELWLAVPVTLVVAFAVLFAGVVSSVLVNATTALLLSFILPVTVSGPVGSIPPRLLGWAFAGGLSLIAIAVLWPTPAREPLRNLTARACALLGRRLRASVEYLAGGRSASLREIREQAVADARTAVAGLRTTFFASPIGPPDLPPRHGRSCGWSMR